jgi:hypothetical protein
VHPIEGYRVARLGWGTVNAQPLTIAFWVYAFRAGNYSGSVRNGGATRSYPFPFTIVAANTWEYKTVTIPGDTTGTWAKDNTAGMTISITLMAGTTFTAPANAWVNGNFAGVNGTANSVTTTSDYMLIAGIIVLPGVEAPSSARLPLIMRPFDQELILCKRYWQLIMPDLRAYSSAAGAFYSFTYNAADMRANPTITVVAAGTTSNASGFTPANFSNRNGELRVVLTAAGIGDCYVNGRTFTLDARL